MKIGDLARELGTTPEAIRFWERSGLVAEPPRRENGYREYGEREAARLRLLLGLRRLDLPLEQAAELAGMCAEGRCDEVSAELRGVLAEKRAQLRRRVEELVYLDKRLAHLEGGLAAGQEPRPLITLGKEENA